MTASIMRFAGPAMRKLLIAAPLTVIGLLAGVTCVVMPLATPFLFVAVAAGLLLWLMPDIQKIPATLSRRMIYVFIFSVLCVPAYYAVIIPGLPWLSARRLALFVFAIPTVIVLSGSSAYRTRIMDALRAVPTTRTFIVIFILCLMLSTAMSSHLSDSLGAVANITTGWVLPCTAILMLLRDRRDIRFAMSFLVFCLLFDLATGFIEFYMRRPFLIYILPAGIRAQVLAANPLYITLFQGQGIRNGLYRAASAFNISLSWGEMAAMIAPIALHFLAHGLSNRERAFGAFGLIASFISIICSGARGAYVGVLAAVIVFALLWSVRLMRTKPGSMIGSNALAIFGTMSALTIFAVVFVGPVRSYVLGSGNTQSSNDARWAEWALAKPKILSSPIWGYGPGTSGTVIGYYPFGSQTPTVDSYIMTALVEFGITGFLAIFAILATSIYLAFSIYIKENDEDSSMGNGLGCSLVAFMVYRITLSQQENMSTMCIVLSLIILLASKKLMSRKHAY